MAIPYSNTLSKLGRVFLTSLSRIYPTPDSEAV